MRSTNPARRLLAVAVAALVAAPTMPALAQGGGGIELEEIVVTARKREENLQQTPIAVSAFSGDSLRRQGIMNVADFNKAIPGIDVHQGSGVAGVANIYIRGVGQRNTEPNLDSGVGIYLDGVYVSRADGALFDMNDVASVQVLRGPQGTLFGKNTTGGAMLIETNRPSEELEGKVSLTVGNYDQLNGAAVLNLPLIDDTLFTRLSLLSVKRDGYIDNVLLDTKYNDEDRLSAIWQLRWIASENLVADLNLNYSKTDQRPRGLQCIPSSVNFGQGWSAVLQDERLIKPSHGGKSVEDFCLESAALPDDKINQNLGGGYNADTKGAAITLNWDISEGLALKSITAWRGTYAGQSDDLEPLPIAWQERTNGDHPFAKDRETEQWSQEFDLTGEAMGGRLNYIAGLYYFTEETDKSRTVGLTGPFYIQNPAIPAAFDVINYNGTATDLFTDNESYAAFLQGDWSISDKWKLTTGIRYTSETRELERISWLPDVPTLSTGSLVATVGPNTYLMFRNTFVPNHGFVVSDVDKADTDADDWTPMVSLSYLLDGVGFIESGSAYITLSKGFRSGGLSEAPSADLEEFDPEEVISTEVGLKFDALDRRLRMNLAVFDLQYDDRQLTTIAVSPQGRIAGATINAKESWVRGVELESTLLPIDNLELTFTGSWYDNDIEEYEDTQLSLTSATTPGPRCVFTQVAGLQSCTIDRSDEDLPRLPEKTLLLAAQYYFETGIGTIVPRLQYSKKYAVDGCFDRNSCLSGDFLHDLEDLSARLTWISTGGEWSISAYGTNLQDKEQVIGGQPLYDAWGFGGVTYAPPRMYGAEFTYNW